MTIDAAGARDELTCSAGYNRPTEDSIDTRGTVIAELFGPDGELKQRIEVNNVLTQVGEQMYGERGAGLGGAPAAPTGMALGTGATAPSKTGAGAAMVTGQSGTAAALGATATSQLSGAGNNPRRIIYTQTWAAGTGTANGLAEVVLQNGTAATIPPNTTVTNVVARALLSPVVNKGAADSLTITWNQDIGVA
jgi:hypothetical protein